MIRKKKKNPKGMIETTGRWSVKKRIVCEEEDGER